MKIRPILVALLLAAAYPAGAASVPLLTGPQDVSQMNATINGVINNINTILSPLTGGGLINGVAPGATGTAVNILSLTPGATGSPAVIGLQPGGDSNGSIQIVPDIPGGNIILFSSATGATGVLQFANSTAVVAATGLAACPGTNPNRAPLGVKGTVSGFIPVLDWLGVAHALVAC